MTKILQAIPSSNLRDRTLFTLLYETGIRVGEALGLLATEVDLTQYDEKIRVFGKGQRERTIMLTAAPESIRLLQAGVPVTTARKQLGRRNIQSTLPYAEVDQATIKQDLQHYQRRTGRQR